MQRTFDPVNRLRSTRIYEIGKRDGIWKVIISRFYKKKKKKVFARILKTNSKNYTKLHFNNTQWTYLYQNISKKISIPPFFYYSIRKNVIKRSERHREQKLKDPLPAKYFER